MTHSNRRNARSARAISITRLPLAVAICLAMNPVAFAQADTAADAAAPAGGAPAASKDKAKTLDTITVTAQKRKENLQKVPISVQVLDSRKLQEHDVKGFDDYVKLLPSVSYDEAGPGAAHVYMRGVSSGGDGNHSGPLPSVGVYLDEEPVTTIDGVIDLHMYDIARVEALSGPQGTLYGASSESGTLKIVTNKPDPGHFAASYSLEANSVDHHGSGYVAEGFINQPLNDHTAIRLVAWDERDGGFITNQFGTRQFPIRNPANGDPPSWGGVLNNGACTSSFFHLCTNTAKRDANSVDKAGMRAALKFDLNDSWTFTPSVMAQRMRVNGNFAQDSAVGDLALVHFYPDKDTDWFYQAALTVEGKIGNFDLTYAYANLYRKVESQADYSDYSFWYDTLFYYGQYICDHFDTQNFQCAPGGHLINPSQHIVGQDWFRKQSHELRIASPKDDPLRFIGGFFWQRQDHDIEQDYVIDGLSPEQSVPGWPGAIWLTKQLRRDQDQAVFGELSWDITDQLTATGGARYFKVNNGLKGFFGFADWGWSGEGVAACPTPLVPFHGAPCTEFDKHVKEDGHIEKLNLTYKIDNDKLIYGTWSKGFRPGGINRRATLAPYLSDFLTNYEFGWKTSWLGHRLTWNGSVFEERWKNFQFAVLGANGLTEIRNANQARVRGLETELNWAATDDLRISSGLSYYDAKLTANYCGQVLQNGTPVVDCPAGSVIEGVPHPFGPQAAAGTRLPLTPKWKGNLTARYGFGWANFDGYVQAALVGVGKRSSDLRVSGFYETDSLGNFVPSPAPAQILGNLPGYMTLDLSAGIKRNGWALDAYVSNALDKRAALTRYAECTETVCGNPDNVGNIKPDIYTVPNQPRTYGLRFTQEF
jgi:outer membrane receptor protein involved in Fe transport